MRAGRLLRLVLTLQDGQRHTAAELAELGVSSYICVPLDARSRTLGTLSLVRLSGELFTEADVEIAGDLARGSQIPPRRGKIARGRPRPAPGHHHRRRHLARRAGCSGGSS